MSPLEGERRFTSAITRGPAGPRWSAARSPLAAGSSDAAARSASRGSVPARRSASDLASATARARNEPVEVTADDSSAPSGNGRPSRAELLDPRRPQGLGLRAASDTQRTAAGLLGGPRPGRTAAGAGRAGGGGGHAGAAPG